MTFYKVPPYWRTHLLRTWGLPGDGLKKSDRQLFRGMREGMTHDRLVTAPVQRNNVGVKRIQTHGSNSHFEEERAISHRGATFSWERGRLACSGSGQDGRA